MSNYIDYVFKNGDIVKIKDFKEPCREFFFKVNLPDTEVSYINGNGEGVWCYTDATSYRKWQDDYDHLIIFVKILNDSFYYTGLNYGTLVAVELRGKRRPVALYHELEDKFGKCNW